MVSNNSKWQRDYRSRLRELGLVYKDAWVLPEHVPALKAIELALRLPGTRITIHATQGVNQRMNENLWTTLALEEALRDSDLVLNQDATVGLVPGADPVINVTMHDYGDLTVQVTVSGETIIAQSVLWERDLVHSPAEFHEAVLANEKMFALANIALDRLPGGEQVYVMYGSLRSGSKLDDIVHEIKTLASNVLGAAAAFRDHLITA